MPPDLDAGPRVARDDVSGLGSRAADDVVGGPAVHEDAVALVGQRLGPLSIEADVIAEDVIPQVPVRWTPASALPEMTLPARPRSRRWCCRWPRRRRGRRRPGRRRRPPPERRCRSSCPGYRSPVSPARWTPASALPEMTLPGLSRPAGSGCRGPAVDEDAVPLAGRPFVPPERRCRSSRPGHRSSRHAGEADAGVDVARDDVAGRRRGPADDDRLRT